jgi:hypothetical protein
VSGRVVECDSNFFSWSRGGQGVGEKMVEVKVGDWVDRCRVRYKWRRRVKERGDRLGLC